MQCRLCPRQCGTDRNETTGYCKSPAEIRIARAALHYWEEPCISGERGTGAVFFSGCNLRCRYCQNMAISRGRAGAEITRERLSDIFLELRDQGAQSIDLVTPTHYIRECYEAVSEARKKGLDLPVVYNSGGYENAEVLRRYSSAFDVFMPDFKYMDHSLAKDLSNCSDYPERAMEAVREMFRITGPAQFNDDGIMTRGVLVRHLVLPGQMENSRAVLNWLFENFGNDIWYSIMSQYTPMGEDPFDDYPDLRNSLSRDEYDELIDFCDDLGIENGFIQEEGTDSKSFIPEFDLMGVFPKE